MNVENKLYIYKSNFKIYDHDKTKSNLSLRRLWKHR